MWAENLSTLSRLLQGNHWGGGQGGGGVHSCLHWVNQEGARAEGLFTNVLHIP